MHIAYWRIILDWYHTEMYQIGRKQEHNSKQTVLVGVIFAIVSKESRQKFVGD